MSYLDSNYTHWNDNKPVEAFLASVGSFISFTWVRTLMPFNAHYGESVKCRRLLQEAR